jgi:hypothetical protein
MVNYNDLGYQELWLEEYVTKPTREDLMLQAMQQWKEGHVGFMLFRAHCKLTGGFIMGVNFSFCAAVTIGANSG